MTSYVPATASEREEMLRAMGPGSVEELFCDIPGELRLKGGLELPEGKSEMEIFEYFSRISEKNEVWRPSFLGGGAYRHFIPAAVRHIVSRGEFYTAYTPYQAEMSQGMLQAIFEYQTLICNLMGLGAANASVYDGAQAAAEAMIMCRGITRKGKFVVSGAVNPQTLEVLRTYARYSGLELAVVPAKNGITDANAIAEAASGAAGVLAAHPNFYGCLEDMQALAEAAYSAGALFVVQADPVSLAILTPPGDYGADIAVAEGQSLGNPLNFGGPYLGVMAAAEKYMRHLPGRIVGQTADKQGRRGFVLTLQAREQHIRRAKASSNICSNQALCALAAAVHLCMMGPNGLREAAELSLQKAHYAFDRICEVKGMRPAFAAPFFKEFVILSDKPAAYINAKLAEAGIEGGLDVSGHVGGNAILYCVTEMNSREDIDRLAQVLEDAV